MHQIQIDLNPSIPALPNIIDKTKINVRYTLISPYVSVHIYWNNQLGELVYEIEEPALNDKEKELLETLESSLGEMININVLRFFVDLRKPIIDYSFIKYARRITVPMTF